MGWMKGRETEGTEIYNSTFTINLGMKDDDGGAAAASVDEWADKIMEQGYSSVFGLCYHQSQGLLININSKDE